MDNYLIQILKEVNTIIIPGIGALTVVNKETGEVMFLPFMKFDDEKLASHIAEKEGWSLNDAKNLVAKYVREITAKLDKGDTYDMYQFGSFSKKTGQDIEFTSWEGKNYTIYDESEAKTILPTDIIHEELTENPIIEVDVANIVEASHEELSEISETESSPEVAENLDFNLNEEINEEIQEKSIDSKTSELLDQEPIEEIADAIAENKIESSTIEKPTEEKMKEAVPPIDDKLPKTSAKQAKSEPELEVSPSKSKIDDLSTPQKELKISDENEESIIERAVEVLKDAIPVIPAKLSVEEQMNDDLDVPPINEVKEIKIKPILEKTEPDKKKRRIPVFLWILLGLLVGGGIYTALNYNNLKQHIPFLADNSSTTKKDAKAEKEVVTETNENSETDEDAQTLVEEESEMIEESAEESIENSQKSTMKTEQTEVTSVPSNSSEFTVNKDLPFQVIVGSFSEKSNAERKVRSLQKSGYAPEIIGQYDGLYFVSLGSFNSMAEVNTNASKISEIGSYWVFKK